MFHRFISSFLHPIIFPLLGSVIYLLTIPRFINDRYKLTLLLIVFIGSYVLPILLLYLFKKLQMIQSFHLKTIAERKFPLLFFSFLAILIGKMLFKIIIVNDLAIYFVSGGVALLLTYVFLWFRVKVSIHTLGIGGLIGFFIQLSIVYHQNFLILIAVLFLLFGLIANARLRLKAHTFREILLGVSFGIAMQLLVPYLYQNI
jgi:hypothetical protein